MCVFFVVFLCVCVCVVFNLQIMFFSSVPAKLTSFVVVVVVVVVVGFCQLLSNRI